MTVHVDDLVSSVTAETPAPAQGASEPTSWEEVTRLRSAQSQLERDQFRTAAEGYDD
jgi:hypothetical protein